MGLPPEGERIMASGSGGSAAPKAAAAEGPASGGPEAGPASGGPEAGQTIGGLTDTAARRAALAAAMIQTFEFRIHDLERWSETQLAALRDPEPPAPAGPGPAPPGVPAASGARAASETAAASGAAVAASETAAASGAAVAAEASGAASGSEAEAAVAADPDPVRAMRDSRLLSPSSCS